MSDKEDDSFIPLERIKFCEDSQGKRIVLGKGGYGTVYKGEFGRSFVAIKEMHSLKGSSSDPVSPQEARNFQRHLLREFKIELENMSRLRHPRFVRYYGYSVNRDGNILIILELVEGGTLEDFVKKSGSKLTLTEKLEISVDIACGLQHLHSKKMVHRDLTSTNVLMTKDERRLNRAVFCDFGLTRPIGKVTNQKCGTPLFLAPEIFNDANPVHTFKSDVYSFGIVLYFLFLGIYPSLGFKTPKDSSPVLKKIIRMIQRCFEQLPQDRCGIDEIVRKLEKTLKLSEEEDLRKKETADDSISDADSDSFPDEEDSDDELEEPSGNGRANQFLTAQVSVGEGSKKKKMKIISPKKKMKGGRKVKRKESEEEKKKRLKVLYRKGRRFFDDKKYDEAKECLLKAAEEGHVNAQGYLGWLYKKIYKKYPEAEEWLLKAAKNGNSMAQNNLGRLYHTIYKKYPEAEEWYLKCVDKSASACWNLGLLYENIHNDKEKALIYYKKGADEGGQKCTQKVKEFYAH